VSKNGELGLGVELISQGDMGADRTSEYEAAANRTSARQAAADRNHDLSIKLSARVRNDYKEFNETNAHLDPDNVAAAKVLYKMNGGSDFDGSDEDAMKYAIEEMGRFNHSFFQADFSDGVDEQKGMVGYSTLMMSDETTDLEKLAFIHLVESYDAMDADNWDELGRFGRAMVGDPTNYTGLGALAGMGIKWGAKKAGGSAFMHALKAGLKVSALGAAEGGAFGAGAADQIQRARIAATDNAYIANGEQYSTDRTITEGAIGATFGALLPHAPAAIKNMWKGTGWIVDKTAQQGTLGMGVGPIDKTPVSAPAGITSDAPAVEALVDTPHRLGVKAREVADQRIALDQEAANLQAQNTGEKVKKIPKRVKIDDLAKTFDADHLETYGRKLDPKSPEDQQVAARAIAKDIDEQMTQANSGAGWYDADVEKTFKMLGEVKGLESLQSNETHRIIWSALSAPTSIGQKVINNTRASTAAALEYFRTGKIPTGAPIKGATTEGIPNAGWGFKQKSVEAGMKVISTLINKHGEEGFADWWLSPHTLSELTAIRKEAGLGGAPTGLSGGKDSVHLGAMILGDKTGRFSLNINGYEGTTKDVWYSRSYNRAFGQMFGANDPKTGLPVVQGGPRNQTERREMEAFNQQVLYNTKLKGLSEADAQAVLWFYEQGLYSRLGVQSNPSSFSEGVGEVHGALGVRSAVRGSDGSEIEIESAADLENFRDISGKQRTIRANRRDAQSGVDNGLGDSKESSPYQREVIGTDGRDGLLSFTPDPDTLAKYQSAGLNLPNINQVDSASSAAAYNADMVSAMSGHKLGAQVEIKSAEDLSAASLFRTESGSGFAIKPDGDIVAVFASPNEPKGGSYSMLQAAVQAGGKKLDAFDTYLPDIYESVGFRPVARLPWNDEFSPAGWDKSAFLEYNNGEPDVVFFVHDPKYFGGAKDVPVVTDYDDAVKLQNEAL
tara:strand:- start:3356 stop:6214 length:2859 start_codon:yes stop_codon:yes gene_type:complete